MLIVYGTLAQADCKIPKPSAISSSFSQAGDILRVSIVDFLYLTSSFMPGILISRSEFLSLTRV